MAMFTRAIEVDGQAWGECLFEADGPKEAFKAALEQLQSVVSDVADLTSAIVVIGESGSDAATRWLGGWVWREAEGFIWLQPD